jgi:hypothetical protein
MGEKSDMQHERTCGIRVLRSPSPFSRGPDAEVKINAIAVCHNKDSCFANAIAHIGPTAVSCGNPAVSVAIEHEN